MKLATVTNIYREDEQGRPIPAAEAIRRAAAVGFRVFDISVGASKNPEHPLNGEHWERWIAEVGEEGARQGVTFVQAHLPFYGVSDPVYLDEERRAFFERSKLRSIHACGVLGVRWAVDHVFQTREDQCYAPRIKENNLRYFAPFVEAAKKAGVGIAFENMIPGRPAGCAIRYPVTHWELADFIDTWNDPCVGACWDFGHANFAYRDQSEPLLALGKRLKALHVDDNFGEADRHLAPLHGTVNWPPVMKALAEIGYEGAFTLEIGKYTDGRPAAVQDILAENAFRLGSYLISLYEQAQA